MKKNMTLLKSITPGDCDAFKKAIYKLDFFNHFNIHKGILKAKIKKNSYLSVDFSKILGNINLSIIVAPQQLKELFSIGTNNSNISIYEDDTNYIITDNSALVSLRKYQCSSDELILPDDLCTQKKLGTTAMIGVINPANTKANHNKDASIMFKLTKNKGPLDFVIIERELVAIGNKHGSLFPVVANTINQIITQNITSVFRAFAFDQFDGLSAELDLFEVPEDPEYPGNMCTTWLEAKITIDTKITFIFFERLIPVTKHNWRY